MSASGQLVARANEALNANPNQFDYPAASDINITARGSDIYWAVTAVMAVSALGFMGASFAQPRKNRIFYYITAGICLVASIAYFTMASNLGYAAIPVEFQRRNPKVEGVYREIFYVRYIDWVITTPLLLLDVLLTAGLPWPTILYTILIDEVMIVTGLIGALVASSYKWGYFVFAMVALFFILYQVAGVGRHYANAINASVGRTYLLCGGWTMALWFIYPIAWGLSEGGNVITPDSEAIFYSILDVLAKPVFGAILIWGHSNIDPEILGLHIREYEELPRNQYVHSVAQFGAPRQPESANNGEQDKSDHDNQNNHNNQGRVAPNNAGARSAAQPTTITVANEQYITGTHGPSAVQPDA